MADITGPQKEALRKIQRHVVGEPWPPRGMMERLEAKGFIAVEWRVTATLGPFVHHAELLAKGRVALGETEAV